MSEFDFLQNSKDDIPEDVRIYVRKSMDILDHLHELMEQNDITQRQLAEKMGKKETEVSKWLNGVQNFTLKTLSKLEAALGAPIVEVPNKLFREKNGITVKSTRLPKTSYKDSTFDFDIKNSGQVESKILVA